MLHRDHNANLVRGNYWGEYRKRLPDRRQTTAFGHHSPIAKEHGRSVSRHHLR